MNYNLGRNEIFWKIGHEESPELLQAIRELEDVGFKDDKGLTYLHVAAINHRLQIVKLLLEKGADPNCEDKRGATPILMALGGKNKNNVEILRLFLKYGLNLQKVINGMKINLNLSVREIQMRRKLTLVIK